MRRARIAVLVIVVGCSSSYGAADGPPPPDPGTEDAGATASCLDKPFTNVAFFPPPINQPGLATYSGAGAGDNALLFGYCQDQGAGADLFFVTRSDPGAPWGAGNRSAVNADGAYDCDLSFTADAKSIFFSSDRPGGVGGRDIWTASRIAGNLNLGTPKNVAAVSSGNDETAPWPTPGGVLYFQSNRGGVDRIWSSRISVATSDFTAPTEVAELNVDGRAGAPVLTADELTIYFASARNGSTTDWDVWMARRASTTEPFGALTLVKELSSEKADYPTWVSSDGCRIVVETYGRPGEQHAQLFYAERK